MLGIIDISYDPLSRHLLQDEDEGANSVGKLVGLWELDLRSSGVTRGARLEHRESLSSLTKLHLHDCSEFTDKGIVCLGRLMALRFLDLEGVLKRTDVGL